MAKQQGYQRIKVPATEHRSHGLPTLMAFLLPLIFSILAWARETLSLMVCSWRRLSSTRWEILPKKENIEIGGYFKLCSLCPPVPAADMSLAKSWA